jgi:arylsulfatase A-like enzyme
MSDPNILMITCHDIGQHLGCYGVETVHTPNIDALAEKGVRVQDFYSTSAVCSPGRGSLHTGRYPQSNGLMGLTHAPWWWSLNEGERHTAHLLREQGYSTTLIGFNHIDPENPERLGYEDVRSTHRQADETVAATLDLIRSASKCDKPFFAKVGFTEVHRPFIHGKDTENGVFVPGWLQDTPQVREDFAEFQATIRFFDERVGEILDTLADSDVADDTLVILTSDHGIPYPGAKWTVRRAGVSVPFLIYQPNTIFDGGRVVDDVMSNVDVLPTLLAYLEAPIPEEIQGVNWMPTLEGSAPPPRDAAFAQYTPEMKRDNLSRTILTDRYHLIRYFDQGRSVDYPVDVHPQAFAAHVHRCPTKDRFRPFVQLYDLHSDPDEIHNLAQDPDQQEHVASLTARLRAWMEEVDDPLLKEPMRTPYYNRAMSDFLNASI